METKNGENMDRRVRKTRAQLRAGLARLMQQKNIKEITVKELVDEIDINRSTFYLHYTDIYQMLQSIEGELMEDILEAIKEHPLDPGMKEEGYSFAIQLFRILAAQSDFKLCANSDYDSRVPAGTRESLRKHRILKLALTAHKMLSLPLCISLRAGCWLFL